MVPIFLWLIPRFTSKMGKHDLPMRRNSRVLGARLEGGRGRGRGSPRARLRGAGTRAWPTDPSSPRSTCAFGGLALVLEEMPCGLRAETQPDVEADVPGASPPGWRQRDGLSASSPSRRSL